MSFDTASAVEKDATTGSFKAHIPEGWRQGRGAFGGLVLGTLLRAMEASEPDPGRRTRALTGDLCGPVLPGPADITVRVLRRGSNQSNLAAELSQSGQVLAAASAVLSTPRTAHDGVALVPPPATDWRELNARPGPEFARHYHYRDAGSERVIHGYISEAEPLAQLDAPAIIGRLDAWWPTLFQIEGPRPIATISFAAQILVEPSLLPAAEPLRYRSQLAAMHDGFFVEMRELWHGERVVALNQQTFAVLK